MKKLTVFGLVVFMFISSAAVISTPAVAEEILVAASGDVQMCPICGKPATAGHTHEPEKEGLPFSVGTDHAFLSKYVWRGLNLTDGTVWQPDAWVSAYGFTFNVWGNMDLTDINDHEGEFNEVDYTFNYAGEYDKLSYTGGVIHYAFPNTDFNSTWEAYGSLGYDTLLQPSLNVYYDFDEADGFYGMLALGHSFELPQVAESVTMSLDLSTHVGFASKNWNAFYYGAEETAFVDYVAGVTLPIGIGEHLTVSPSVSYSTVLDKTLRTNAVNDHNFIYGATVSASF